MAEINYPLANTSGFIPTIWAAKALDVLRAEINLAKLVSSDRMYEPSWKGRTLNIGYPGTFTTQSKVDNTPLTSANPVNGATVPLTLDHHQAVAFTVEDFASALATGTLMERFIQPAVIALAEGVETDLHSNVGLFNASVGTQGTDLSYTTIVGAQAKLNTAKAPKAGRFFLLSVKDNQAMQLDTTLQRYFDNSHTATVEEGVIGRLAGFDFYLGQLVPTNSASQYVVTNTGASTVTFGGQTTGATATSTTPAQLLVLLNALSSVPAGSLLVTGTTLASGLTITKIGKLALDTGAFTVGANATVAVGVTTTASVAMHKNALALAVRPFDDIPAGAGVMSATQYDAESGLSLRLSAQYDINNVGMRINLDLLYGFKVIRPELGVNVYS